MNIKLNTLEQKELNKIEKAKNNLLDLQKQIELIKTNKLELIKQIDIFNTELNKIQEVKKYIWKIILII